LLSKNFKIISKYIIIREKRIIKGICSKTNFTISLCVVPITSNSSEIIKSTEIEPINEQKKNMIMPPFKRLYISAFRTVFVAPMLLIKKISIREKIPKIALPQNQ
jgi:hypothetical protein